MMDEGVKAVKSNKTLSHINQVDVQIAETPADVVFSVDKVTLSRYRPLTKKKANTPPVLICYGLFGRQTMIDLQEDRSLVRSLLNDGIDVYVVDWGNPTRADQFLTLDDYINGYLRDCVDFHAVRLALPPAPRIEGDTNRDAPQIACEAFRIIQFGFP